MLQLLSENSYLRERMQPRVGDSLYLHLSDLLLALKDLIVSSAPRVLDFGCGGSPYRSLFSCVEYHGADLPDNAARDITLVNEAKLPDALEPYDLVLSTQVLEHVSDPGLYLSECYRALKPGGTLVVSTHGIFEDHPCPTDFWRWTASGLQRACEQAGFEVERTIKITTDARASIFLLERELGMLATRTRWSLIGIGFKLLAKAGSRRLHNFADRYFCNCRAVPASGDVRDTRYIGVAVKATRPNTVIQ